MRGDHAPRELLPAAPRRPSRRAVQGSPQQCLLFALLSQLRKQAPGGQGPVQRPLSRFRPFPLRCLRSSSGKWALLGGVL